VGKVRKGSGGSDDLRAFFRRKFDIDIPAVYEQLEDVGRISVRDLEKRGKMIEALNVHADLEQKARQLAHKAKRLYSEFMIGYNKRLRKLEKRATARIKAWLDATGIKSRKQITKDEVVKELCSEKDTRIEYRRLERERLDMEEIRDNCASLAERWKGRGYLLDAQSRALNAKVEVNLNPKEKGRS